LPFRTADGSEPEPDFAIVPGAVRRAKEHPSSAVLIVEISDTTLGHDRNKARLYALSGVPEYWIVNVVGRNVEVYRSVEGQHASKRYGSPKILTEHDRIAPLNSKLEIEIADLLP